MVCKECKAKPVSRRDADATKTGLCDERLERPFPITSVCRLDLLDKCTPQDIGRFDDADMSRLAEKMADAYTHAVFWVDLEILAQGLLEEK